jgi:hypothetical protein
MKTRTLALLAVAACLGLVQASPAIGPDGADLPVSSAPAAPDAPEAPVALPDSPPEPVKSCVGTINWFAFSQSYCDGSEAGGHCSESCASGETGQFVGWNGQYCKCICCVDLEIQ